ncbi:VWA domain-containing protein [Kibdelosporangium aridum]|uniref:VWA domain-containing protein n=1 Tax=Kibdelosporangium aridum TaxID=2030 RepID=UPI001F1E447C|nr:VWA domain-containing protein [Kibdelosporangium aridum]
MVSAHAEQPNGQNLDIDVKPAQIVILVDQSGSIRQEDMIREQNAASLLAQSELSTRSTVSIVGFASDSGSKPPVDVVCPPLLLTGAPERERIAQCIGGLRKRAAAEGHGTDHAEALKQAMSYLGQGSPADGPKLVFLLTDGVLDVSDSPRYGVDKTAQQRNDAAQQVIRQTLDVARDKGVQIWPLGFGKVDKNALDQFAAGGFQGSCGPSVPKPSATVVSTSEDVTGALLRSFSSGRCVGVGSVTNSQLGSGRDIEVPVTIPAIATDGSIIVVKNDSRISVEYIDPQGQPVSKSGESASGKFQASGENSAVEVLRVVNPAPGDWKVRVTSPPEVPPQNVLTAVTWQGAAQAVLHVDPPSPAVGQQVTVSLKVVLRGGKPVVRPELLQGLSFTAEMAGENVPARPITLQDNGQNPDDAADGTFTGRLTIPADAQQGVSLRGRVTGLGISAADAIANVTIAPQLPTVLATTTLPTLSSTVEPGDSLPATATISNNSGQRQRIQIGVQADGDAAITVPAEKAVHEVDPGTTTVNFDMAFGSTSPEGATTGVIRIVDAADPSRILHEKSFTVEVGYPFPWLRWIAGTALGAGLIVFALILVARRRDQEVEGLVVEAIRDGHRVSLQTAAQKAKQFRFTVDTSGPVPRLNIAEVTEPVAFVLTRSRKGLRLKTPFDGARTMQLGQEVDLGDGLTIVVLDPAYGDGQEPVSVGGGTPDDLYSPPGPQQSQDPLL